jgi:hypothetical protein
MGHGHVTPNPDGSKTPCGGPGLCGTCNQEAATAGFYSGSTPEPQQPAPGQQGERLTCPACGTCLVLRPVRVTEVTPPPEGQGHQGHGAR